MSSRKRSWKRIVPTRGSTTDRNRPRCSRRRTASPAWGPTSCAHMSGSNRSSTQRANATSRSSWLIAASTSAARYSARRRLDPAAGLELIGRVLPPGRESNAMWKPIGQLSTFRLRAITSSASRIAVSVRAAIASASSSVSDRASSRTSLSQPSARQRAMGRGGSDRVVAWLGRAGRRIVVNTLTDRLTGGPCRRAVRTGRVLWPRRRPGPHVGAARCLRARAGRIGAPGRDLRPRLRPEGRRPVRPSGAGGGSSSDGRRGRRLADEPQPARRLHDRT